MKVKVDLKGDFVELILNGKIEGKRRKRIPKIPKKVNVSK